MLNETFYVIFKHRNIGKTISPTLNIIILQIDDQISLLINAWCELLVFSCCYRSIETPGVIRVSNQKRLNLEEARSLGIDKWIEKMLNFSDQLRRLRIDAYEYVSMKVIVLLTSSGMLAILKKTSRCPKLDGLRNSKLWSSSEALLM